MGRDNGVPAPVRPPPATAPGQKVNFNAIPAPSNYVPGLGRGATGFTTRSDIGPARMAPEMPTAPGQGAKPPPAAKADEGGADEGEFDDFMGNDAGALAGAGEYDADDKEADEVWEKIDSFMDERRRERRERRIKEDLEKFRLKNPKITEQFADLKRKLADVAEAEWEAIPDIGDTTVKRHKREHITPAPDSLLDKALSEKRLETSLAPGGLATPGGMTTNLTEIGEGRRMVVDLSLGRMADSVTGQTVVDPKGYLTDLSGLKVASDSEIGDIMKARTLLKSVTNTNPKHAPGWIAAARLEEVAGKLGDARKLISKGIENCPRAEDVWLEAARLQPPENAKAILARGVAANPTSVKLWLQASRLEADAAAKSRVLRKGLEQLPHSVLLWKAVVELASEGDARILLQRAVECCPQHVELWLALARLESYDNARQVLNNARKANPTDIYVWIHAAKLEESQGNGASLAKVILRAFKLLQKESVVIDRETWLREAEAAERAKPPMVLTCRAIVGAVVGVGVEEEDRKRTWKGDAEEALKRGSVETARAILAHALATFPTKKGLWRRAAQLEKAHGSREALGELLSRAVQSCPQAEVLWLMAAKEKWLAGRVGEAREVLAAAFVQNPDSEQIWLAAFKLEFENNEPLRAQKILEKARHSSSSTERVWMKSALVERELGHTPEERALLVEGVRLFPAFHKLHLMLGQLALRQGDRPGAQAAFQAGLKHCQGSVPLWRALARLEEEGGNTPKARAILEQGRLKNPGSEELWLAAMRLEQRAGLAKNAETLLAKALQDCPASGALWAEAVSQAPRPQRKSKASDALRRCDNDPRVTAAVAQLFWQERKVEKAREWFNRAVLLAPDEGDAWAAFAQFERQHGTPAQQAALVERVKAAEPRHGERWQRIAKDPGNAHQGPEALLQLVLADLENPLPP